LVLVFLASPVFGFVGTVHGDNAETYLVLTPTTYVANQIAETFDIGVDVLNAANMLSSQFELTYDPSVLSTVLVVPGSSILSPPIGSFSYQVNEALGSIRVNASTVPGTPIGGNESLATVTFQVIGTPQSCDGSALDLAHSILLDASSVSITHDVVGAVVFWQNIGPDPPVSGRVLDLYTQKGGTGQGTPDGSFVGGELVTLTASVTFNDAPVQQKLVSFEVKNPLNETVVLRSGITDSLGKASISFRIPFDPSSVGEWTAIALVDIAEETVWDTVTFFVNVPIPVGGYSTITAQTPETPTLPISSILIFAAALAILAVVSAGFSKHRNSWAITSGRSKKLV